MPELALDLIAREEFAQKGSYLLLVDVSNLRIILTDRCAGFRTASTASQGSIQAATGL